MSGTTIMLDSDAAVVSSIGIDNLLAAYPLDAHLYAVSDLMEEFRALAAFAKLDFFYSFYNMTQAGADINWCNYDIGKLKRSADGLTWVAKQGYEGDGTDGYLRSGLYVDRGQLKMTQDDCQIGCHVRTIGAGADISVAVSAGANAFIVPKNLAGTHTRFRVFQSTTTDIAYSGQRDGYYYARRAASTGISYKLPDGTIASATQASATPTGEVTLLGGAATKSSDEISLAWGGRALSTGEYNALEVFMDRVMSELDLLALS